MRPYACLLLLLFGTASEAEARRWHNNEPRKDRAPTSNSSNEETDSVPEPEQPSVYETTTYPSDEEPCWRRVSCASIGYNYAYGRYGWVRGDSLCVFCEVDMCRPNNIYAQDIVTLSGYPQRRTSYICFDPPVGREK